MTLQICHYLEPTSNIWLMLIRDSNQPLENSVHSNTNSNHVFPWFDMNVTGTPRKRILNEVIHHRWDIHRFAGSDH